MVLGSPLTPFRIVERVTNSREHQFEIHINIREKPSTGVVRGVDVGGKHLAVTADTNGITMIPNMRHRSILREISALQSIRTRKGKRRKRKIEKKIIQLRQKANNIANDSMNRMVHTVTKGVDRVVLEDLSPISMTRHGGNHKITMNRSMRENRVGEFRRKVVQKCEALGIELVAVPARYTRGRFTRPTSQTCHVCGNVEINHDQLGTLSICNQEFHADINAAFSNRFLCMGRQSVSSGGRFTRPTGGVRAGIMATIQSHVLPRNEVP